LTRLKNHGGSQFTGRYARIRKPNGERKGRKDGKTAIDSVDDATGGC